MSDTPTGHATSLNTAWIDKHSVVLCRFGQRPVDLGVPQVRLDHPGLQIVDLMCPLPLCGGSEVVTREAGKIG
jgi:hypothetical protein